MSLPFLEIVTRHYTARPDYFHRCRASVMAQSEDNYVWTVIEDDVGRGVEWANKQLAEHDPQGAYVWVLDDDDMCTHDGLVRDLMDIAILQAPDVIMAKNDIAEHHGILPDETSWKAAPVFCHVSMSTFVVTAEVWRRHRGAFRGQNGADWRFLHAVWEAEPRPTYYWWDQVIMRIQRRSLGMPQ